MKHLINIFIFILIPSYTYGQNLAFPDVVEKFIAMTEIQQKDYEKSIVNKPISGRGKIANVEECGFTSESKSFGKKCYELILDKGAPRVVLYFSLAEKSRVMQFRKGEQFEFSNCNIVGIRSFGFWSTVYCDMNFAQPQKLNQISNPIINKISPAEISKKLNIPILIASILVRELDTIADYYILDKRIDLNGDGIKDYVFQQTDCGNATGCNYIGIISSLSNFIAIDLGRDITIKEGTAKGLPIIEDHEGFRQWSINYFKIIKVKESSISVNCEKKQVTIKGLGDFLIQGRIREIEKVKVIEGTIYRVLTVKGELLNGSRASHYHSVVYNFESRCPGILN